MTNINRISPQEAQAKLDSGYTFVDVRSEQEFAAGHPKGAYNVPLLHMGPSGMTPNPDFLNVMKATFKADTKLVLGCKAGGRSLRAAEALVAAGFSDLFDQRAGWDGARDSFGQLLEAGWSGAGLPKEDGAPEGRSYASLVTGAK